MTGRYVVRKQLPMLWSILDTWTLTTEYVLFGDGVGNYVRAWITEEAERHRADLLELMVEKAKRAGIRHSLRLPHRFVPVTYDDGRYPQSAML